MPFCSFPSSSCPPSCSCLPSCSCSHSCSSSPSCHLSPMSYGAPTPCGMAGHPLEVVRCFRDCLAPGHVAIMGADKWVSGAARHPGPHGTGQHPARGRSRHAGHLHQGHQHLSSGRKYLAAKAFTLLSLEAKIVLACPMVLVIGSMRAYHTCAFVVVS